MEVNDKKTEENKKKLKTSQTYTKRVIVHPSFYNISFSKAVALMENMDQGECIIRPSSKVLLSRLILDDIAYKMILN